MHNKRLILLDWFLVRLYRRFAFLCNTNYGIKQVMNTWCIPLYGQLLSCRIQICLPLSRNLNSLANLPDTTTILIVSIIHECGIKGRTFSGSLSIPRLFFRCFQSSRRKKYIIQHQVICNSILFCSSWDYQPPDICIYSHTPWTSVV